MIFIASGPPNASTTTDLLMSFSLRLACGGVFARLVEFAVAGPQQAPVRMARCD
jgi:hypothetical protein